MKLTLPYLPAKELSPNWMPFTPRAVWILQEARDSMIRDVYFLAVNALFQAKITERPAFERIRITYTFTVSTNRRRDEDNWRARMKPAQDALVYAGVVSDDTYDRVTVNRPKFVVQKGTSETIIKIEEMER